MLCVERDLLCQSTMQPFRSFVSPSATWLHLLTIQPQT